MKRNPAPESESTEFTIESPATQRNQPRAPLDDALGSQLLFDEVVERRRLSRSESASGHTSSGWGTRSRAPQVVGKISTGLISQANQMRVQAVTEITGLAEGNTSPISLTATPAISSACDSSFACSGATEINRPPAVCGSKSRAFNSALIPSS